MNLFANYPPIIPWLVIAITLGAMVQFGSTEKLAAAFAWLIFVAILLANGQQAITNLKNLNPTQPTNPLTGKTGTSGSGIAGN